ncbi:MAG TPA: GWxTD domain-containing protein [candidate division Zixibacteria bacterium]|nr:GWxTD domain-containing protein [candidate division Zixibacteria bacterium]MDM7972265.1 GWxTD domain-containing protein [candidate division Zixibacteria bacterium]HPM35937.1 GWxTD domain-containing protein [candidate division Zixibacteria bacterium]
MVRTFLRLTVLGLLVWVVAAAAAFGQSPLLRRAITGEAKKLIVGTGVFPSEEPGRVRLEVYYQVYNYALDFQQLGGLFRARYVTTIRVNDRKADTTAAVSREEREAVVDALAKTTSTADYRAAQVNFDLPPGDYEVLFLIENVGSSAILKRDFDLRLEPFDSRSAELSDIELAQAAGPNESDSAAGAFAKGEFIVVPSLTGSFSGDDGGRLLFYLEIHRGGDSLSEVTVVTALRHESKGMVYRDSLTTALPQRITRQLREISLDGFMPGDYRLEVSLHGRRYKQLDQRQAEFRIPWTAASVLRYDWNAALDQLELIADGNEIKPLRKIDSLADRVAALDRFWAERDPDPTTAVNEIKVVFYYRVDLANRLFSILNMEGWRTDRGRVLIRYGEPDQIDDYPLVADRYPYQEWHYYKDRRYRKFVFVDVNDDGDYRLQYPYDGLYQRPDF